MMESNTKRKTCCVTGHRELPADQLPAIKQRLQQEIETAVRDGYKYFLSGFADGVDLLFVELLLGLKKHHPHLSIGAALPYPKKGNVYYRDLLRQCNEISYACPKYHPGCVMARNRIMVQTSDRVIVVYDGRGRGGTFFTLRYAYVMEKEVKIMTI